MRATSHRTDNSISRPCRPRKRNEAKFPETRRDIASGPLAAARGNRPAGHETGVLPGPEPERTEGPSGLAGSPVRAGRAVDSSEMGGYT